MLHDWWSDYDAFRKDEDDQALGLPSGLWPWTMDWYGEVPYQDDSNSTRSLASPFLQDSDQLWDQRPEYEEDYILSPSSHSKPSIHHPQEPPKATAPKPPIHSTNARPKPILPRPNDSTSQHAISNNHNYLRGDPQPRRRSTSTDSRDVFLVQSKLAGMSYKAIKEQGAFVEAESTLQGRFRTLTKHKEHRVRKPEWVEGDVSSACPALAIPDPASYAAAVDESADWAPRQSGTGGYEGFERREGGASFWWWKSCGMRWRSGEDTVKAGGGVYLGAWGQLSVRECDVSEEVG